MHDGREEDWSEERPTKGSSRSRGGPSSEGSEICFDAFSLDLQAAELFCHGEPVSIRSTPLRLLLTLGRRFGRIVPKQQILDEVWPDTAVTEASLSTALRELRQTLGDDGRRQRLIQTFRHRGVRLLPRSADPPLEAGANVPLLTDAGDETPDDVHFALLARLGSTLFEGGRGDDARNAYRAAARSALRRGNRPGFVHAVLGLTCELGSLGLAVPSAEEAALLEQALAFQDAVPLAVRARLRARLAASLPSVRRERAVMLATDALRMARVAGEPSAWIGILHDAYWVLGSPDDIYDRRTRAQEMVRAGEAAGDLFAVGIAHQLESATWLEAGNRMRAEAASERADRGIRTRDHPLAPAWRSGWHACMALLDGRFREAELHLEEAFRIGRAMNAPNAPRIHALQLAWLRFEQGRLGELAPLADALELDRPLARAARALLLDAAGHGDEAHRELDAMVDALPEIARDLFWLGTMVILAELAVRLESRGAASVLYAAMRPYEAQCVLIGSRSVCRGSVALYLGLLADTAGRPEDVVPHLDVALRGNASLRALPLLARTQLALAGTLTERAQGSDLVRAKTLLAASADSHRGLGLTYRDAAIASLRARLEQRLTGTAGVA